MTCMIADTHMEASALPSEGFAVSPGRGCEARMAQNILLVVVDLIPACLPPFGKTLPTPGCARGASVDHE